jgi:hypothetical protein
MLGCEMDLGAPMFCPKRILDIGLRFVQIRIYFRSLEAYVPTVIQARYKHVEYVLPKTCIKSICHQDKSLQTYPKEDGRCQVA